MEVDVRDGFRFVRELRLVEVRDVVVLAVEHVVQRGRYFVPLAQAIPRFQVDHGCPIRSHTVVFDERCLAEMTEARAAEPAARMIYCDANRRDLLDRAGNAITGRIEIPKSRSRPREI